MKAPHFWSAGLDPKSREAAPVTRALLTPLSALYTAGIRRKLGKAAPLSVRAGVVCVGNLTVGGVGKTPIVEAIRARLSASGKRTASLSRGYGGTQTTPLRVDPATHTAGDVGDEPLMLAKTGESWVGRDRRAAAAAMVSDGVEMIVMDDGHQNPSLAKNLSLVVIDSAAPFGNGYVLPKGPLREPVMDGLARADAVVLVGGGQVPEAVREAGVPVLSASVEAEHPVPDGPLVAFAGIGRPLKFFDALTQAGADLREAVGYGDHHAYRQGELSFLRRLAADHGARLITTTKDFARLPAADRDGILTFPVRAKFENVAALDALLEPLLTLQFDD